jgi:hypothetical protein
MINLTPEKAILSVDLRIAVHESRDKAATPKVVELPQSRLNFLVSGSRLGDGGN